LHHGECQHREQDAHERELGDGGSPLVGEQPDEAAPEARKAMEPRFS
jgi:hypothetical protein